MIRTFALLCLAHFFVDFFVGIWPIYKTIAQIDLAVAGLISGIAGFCGEILQLYWGYLSDRGHRKKVIIFGLCISSAILWVTHTSHPFVFFLILLFLTIGSGAFHPSASGSASRLFSGFKGRSILLFTSFGVIGLGFSQMIFTTLIEKFNGHASIVFIPLALIIAFLMFHRFPELPSLGFSFSIKSFFSNLKHQRKFLIPLYIAQVTSYGFSLSFIFTLPELLKLKNNHSWLCMGGGHMIFVLGSALSMVIVSLICHRWGFRRTILISLSSGIAILGYLLFFSSTSFVSTFSILILLGSTLCITNPMIVAWGNHRVPESPSSVSALLMGLAWCLSNLFPIITGFLTKFVFNGSLISALLTMSIFLFVSFFFIFSIEEEAPEPIPINSTR